MEGKILGWLTIIILALGVSIFTASSIGYFAFDVMGKMTLMCFATYSLMLMFLGAHFWYMWWHYDVPRREGAFFTMSSAGYVVVLPATVMCIWMTWFVLQESRVGIHTRYFELKPSEALVLELERLIGKEIDRSVFDYSLDRQTVNIKELSSSKMGAIFMMIESPGSGVPLVEVLVKAENKRYQLILNTDRSSLYGYEQESETNRYEKDIICYLAVPIRSSGLPVSIIKLNDGYNPFQNQIENSSIEIYVNSVKVSQGVYRIFDEKLVHLINDELAYREKSICLNSVWDNERERGTSMLGYFEMQSEIYAFSNKYVYPHIATDIYSTSRTDTRMVVSSWKSYENSTGSNFKYLVRSIVD